MPSSAQVSFISTPFSHYATSTSSSSPYQEPTSFKFSSLIADFIGLWSRGTFHPEAKPIEKQVSERNFQAGFSKIINEEISELINGYINARSMLQTARGETGNKLKIRKDLLAKVFELVDHKTAQEIILAIYDLMAQGVLQFKGKASQKHLYIIYSFILRSWPLVNIPFQSKELFNIFENFLFKTPLIQEYLLWCFEQKDNVVEKNQVVLKSARPAFSQVQSKECSDDNLVEDHDKCSTASRSSITTHERNYEMLDIIEFGITSSSPQKTSFELGKVQPVFEIYEGFFMGDLDIDFCPSDNHLSNFDQEKNPNYQKYNNYNNHYYQSPYYQRPAESFNNNQETIQLKLFTLPQTNHMMGYPSSSFPVKEQSYQRVKNNVHHQASSAKANLNTKTKMQAKSVQNPKSKEKILSKSKKTEEKGFKLWDMISVNGKLKKN